MGCDFRREIVQMMAWCTGIPQQFKFSFVRQLLGRNVGNRGTKRPGGTKKSGPINAFSGNPAFCTAWISRISVSRHGLRVTTGIRRIHVLLYGTIDPAVCKVRRTHGSAWQTKTIIDTSMQRVGTAEILPKDFTRKRSHSLPRDFAKLNQSSQ
jgi:hypothetical protein